MRCHKCGKKGHWGVDCTEELSSRCHGREHAADVCPTSKEEAVLAASDDDDDHDTVEASAFKAGEAGECSDVLGKKGEEESAWQVGNEAWLCDSEESAHMAPSADGMISSRKCNLKLRIADMAILSLSFGPKTVSYEYADECCARARPPIPSLVPTHSREERSHV